MVPLPDCASGEWGPTKATRLFGLIPISHQVRNARAAVPTHIIHIMQKFIDFLVSVFSTKYTLFIRFVYAYIVYGMAWYMFF